MRIENGHHGCAVTRMLRPKLPRPVVLEPRPVEPIPFDKYLRRVNREDSTEMWRPRAEPECQRLTPEEKRTRELPARAPRAESRPVSRHPLSPARIGDNPPIAPKPARPRGTPPSAPGSVGSIINVLG